MLHHLNFTTAILSYKKPDFRFRFIDIPYQTLIHAALNRGVDKEGGVNLSWFEFIAHRCKLDQM